MARSAEHIKGLQRKLSYKKKGSKNREKSKVLLKKSRRKVGRQRDDFTHKLTKDNKLITFEDSKYGEKTFARIGNNGLLGQLRQLPTR
ncbi:MAG: hypothetical protein QXY52_06845 [Conexivisphaerales archaeon]